MHARGPEPHPPREDHLPARVALLAHPGGRERALPCTRRSPRHRSRQCRHPASPGLADPDTSITTTANFDERAGQHHGAPAGAPWCAKIRWVAAACTRRRLAHHGVARIGARCALRTARCRRVRAAGIGARTWIPLENLGLSRRSPAGRLQLYRNGLERLPVVSDDLLMTGSSPAQPTRIKDGSAGQPKSALPLASITTPSPCSAGDPPPP